MIFIGICAVAALAMAGYGALRVLGEQRRLEPRIAALEEKQISTFDPARLQSTLDRFTRDGEEMQALLVRSAVAIARIRKGLDDLRLPQAVAALRVAGTAIAALRHLH